MERKSLRQVLRWSLASATGGLVGVLPACGTGSEPSQPPAAESPSTATGSAGGSARTSTDSSTPEIVLDPDLRPEEEEEERVGEILTELPDGFVEADTGGYRLVGELGDSTINGGGVCGNVIRGVVRDFKDGSMEGGHPDFEAFCCGVLPGIVASTLGEGRKPRWNVGVSNAWQTTTEENFNQWYASVPDVNAPYTVELYLAPQPDGMFTFASSAFFPLDDAGFGNQDHGRNYHFTTEIHTSFRYAGGEIFQFTGDDDLWVFMNGQLVIDLGGVHADETLAVNVDEVAPTIGMQLGEAYDLDLFHAERRMVDSNFRIDSSLDLLDCGEIVPDVIY